MNIKNEIKPITYLKSQAADLLKQINETHRPVIITQNRAGTGAGPYCPGNPPWLPGLLP